MWYVYTDNTFDSCDMSTLATPGLMWYVYYVTTLGTHVICLHWQHQGLMWYVYTDNTSDSCDMSTLTTPGTRVICLLCHKTRTHVICLLCDNTRDSSDMSNLICIHWQDQGLMWYIYTDNTRDSCEMSTLWQHQWLMWYFYTDNTRDSCDISTLTAPWTHVTLAHLPHLVLMHGLQNIQNMAYYDNIPIMENEEDLLDRINSNYTTTHILSM